MRRLRIHAVLLAILAATAGLWPLAAQNQGQPPSGPPKPQPKSSSAPKVEGIKF